jgi:di/tricarboxylate transporter
MEASTISLVVLLVAVLLFVWNRLPVEIVAIGVALTLVATGVLTLNQGLAGFGDPVVIFVAALFVVSEGIDATGLTTWAGQRLIDYAGDRPRLLFVLVLLLCAAVTALITLNGAVAALLPMVVVLAMRTGSSPGRWTMPLAFAGSAGSLLALTGTPINVIVSQAAVAAGEQPFGFFEFAIVGVPLTIGTITICVLLGPRVLPTRQSKTAPANLSQHASTLVEHYAYENDLYRLRIRARSPLVGTRRDAIDIGGYPEVSVVAVQRGHVVVEPDDLMQEDDVVVLRGAAESVNAVLVEQCLAMRYQPRDGDPADTLVGPELGVAEVVIPPRSALIGLKVFPGMRRPDDRLILAVHRMGDDRGDRETTLQVGDTLLVQGTWAALDRTVADPEVLVVDSPDLLRRQAAPLGTQARAAALVLAVMVVLMASAVVPPVVAALLAACAMVLTRVVSVEQAYRAISWTTVVLIGGMISLSEAMQVSGAADRLATVLLDIVGDRGPYALMLGLFLLTALLGQFVSNTATALIVVPIAVSATSALHLEPRPFLMMMAVAAAASFLTPVATPANMMVMGPGGYRFGDYWRLGLPVMAWFLVVSLVVIPQVWAW